MDNQYNSNSKETLVTRVEDRTERIKKIEKVKLKKINPYAGKYSRTEYANQITKEYIGKDVAVCGRIKSIRKMGKIIFIDLVDFTGKIQLVAKEESLPVEKFELFMELLSTGDFIGAEGSVFETNRGEISILINNWTLLSKALMSIPKEEIKDPELIYRKRYIDLLTNEGTMNRFKLRSDFIKELRSFYHKNFFYEIDTPVLCNTASGALAKPFKTHHNSLDIDVFLRIAPELYLKECILGGFERVFEIARVFRNEGSDPSHLQDFTMIEHYCAYWDYEENMKFTEKMLTEIVFKLKNTYKITALNKEGNEVEINLEGPWPAVSFRDLLIKDIDIDIDKYADVLDLRKVIASKGINVDNIENLGRGNLIDSLYKKVSRPKLVNPIFVLNQPIDLSPLARKSDGNPLEVDRFQLVINGWEIVNSYSELIDPIDQAERFLVQTKAKNNGDEEALEKDEDYIEAMEYGMPPMSGWGMGVERMLALLTNQSNLRDVVMFPLIRPE